MQVGAIKDLDEAIVLNREALDVRPHGHPLRFSILNNLAADLFHRYEKFAEMEDLDEAIVLGREALSLCSYRHPDRSNLLYNLASQLRTRFARLGMKMRSSVYTANSLTQPKSCHPVISLPPRHGSVQLRIPGIPRYFSPTKPLRLLAQHLTSLPSLP